jgi:hypothetical protein
MAEPDTHIPGKPCPVCSQLKDEEYALQKFGREENNTSLPIAANLLTIVHDFRPLSNRKLQLHQCPQCASYFLYRTDYEYLVNGSEDEEFLTRLTTEQTEVYLNQILINDPLS